MAGARHIVQRKIVQRLPLTFNTPEYDAAESFDRNINLVALEFMKHVGHSLFSFSGAGAVVSLVVW